MGDEYQLRRDIDRIYDKTYNYDEDIWNIYTKDEINEKLTDNYYDKGQIDEIVIGDISLDNYYTIMASNYNPTIDGTVTITVTVTDGNNQPVTNHSFTLNIDDTTPISLTTDNTGSATHTYTCSSWGVHTFNVGTSNCQIKVKGYKQVVNETQYQVYENEEHYYVVINTSVTFTSTSWVTDFTIPSPYRPLTHIPLSCSDRQTNGRFATTGAVQVINLTTTQRTSGVSGIAVIKK